MSVFGGDRCSQLPRAYFRFHHIPIGKALRSNMVDRIFGDSRQNLDPTWTDELRWFWAPKYIKERHPFRQMEHNIQKLFIILHLPTTTGGFTFYLYIQYPHYS